MVIIIFTMSLHSFHPQAGLEDGTELIEYESGDGEDYYLTVSWPFPLSPAFCLAWCGIIALPLSSENCWVFRGHCRLMWLFS